MDRGQSPQAKFAKQIWEHSLSIFFQAASPGNVGLLACFRACHLDSCRTRATRAATICSCLFLVHFRRLSCISPASSCGFPPPTLVQTGCDCRLENERGLTSSHRPSRSTNLDGLPPSLGDGTSRGSGTARFSTTRSGLPPFHNPLSSATLTVSNYV
ncbi:hypothetical protein K432DRAFT_166749 [Lepidopterella palustris CBS 459.81]|uniref:Uncharacterized protein n=1 Tax=Lepidopterella palustris CBS 459.81 TaxID=1314670 RepID=A0A8E2E1P3_9PEZI|nr:hypothetical protein K432DRAFT_166749 [Lepidopterella palustris CBS 459.81]